MFVRPLSGTVFMHTQTGRYATYSLIYSALFQKLDCFDAGFGNSRSTPTSDSLLAIHKIISVHFCEILRFTTLTNCLELIGLLSFCTVFLGNISYPCGFYQLIAFSMEIFQILLFTLQFTIYQWFLTFLNRGTL